MSSLIQPALHCYMFGGGQVRHPWSIFRKGSFLRLVTHVFMVFERFHGIKDSFVPVHLSTWPMLAFVLVDYYIPVEQHERGI